MSPWQFGDECWLERRAFLSFQTMTFHHKPTMQLPLGGQQFPAFARPYVIPPTALSLEVQDSQSQSHHRFWMVLWKLKNLQGKSVYGRTACSSEAFHGGGGFCSSHMSCDVFVHGSIA